MEYRRRSHCQLRGEQYALCTVGVVADVGPDVPISRCGVAVPSPTFQNISVASLVHYAE